MQIPAAFSVAQSSGNGADKRSSNPLAAPAPIAVFTKVLRSLTNYEVWRRAESAILLLPSDQDSESQDWSRIRALLEELQWRLSGLEGAGPPTPRLPVTLSTGPDE